MNELSLLTIVGSNGEHLHRMLRGVAKQRSRPREMIIIFLDGPAPDTVPDPGCPLYLHSFSDAKGGLPVAAARNKAASLARGNLLVFLEPDCVPGPNCLHLLQLTIGLSHAIVATQVVEQPPSPTESEGYLEEPMDAAGGSLTPLPYPDFRSYCFGLRAADYARIGGYDELYRGYGPEDTDFAFAARDIKLQVLRCTGVVYRQQPAVATRPATDLREIVANAASFYHKWQQWPMPELLRELNRAGKIRLTKNAIQINKDANGFQK